MAAGDISGGHYLLMTNIPRTATGAVIDGGKGALFAEAAPK